jgi:hypothetical protein
MSGKLCQAGRQLGSVISNSLSSKKKSEAFLRSFVSHMEQDNPF